MPRPLEDRIGELSTKAADSKKPEELERVITDFRLALHEKASQLRYMVNDAKEAISNLGADRVERRKLDRRKTDRRNKPGPSV